MLTNVIGFAIISLAGFPAGIAQPVEQLICNQQVGGSNPSTSSIESLHDADFYMGEFPSGQRGQTVNLLAMPTVVRIHPPPPSNSPTLSTGQSWAVVDI